MKCAGFKIKFQKETRRKKADCGPLPGAVSPSSAKVKSELNANTRVFESESLGDFFTLYSVLPNRDEAGLAPSVKQGGCLLKKNTITP